MFALVAPSWLPWAAAFLSGLLIKWLLDLFFLRRSMFETQQALQTRERQITDLRHELNRSIETLKNRTTELDANVRAKAAAEALAAQRLAENLAAAERAASEIGTLTQALSIHEATEVRLREEIQTLLGQVAENHPNALRGIDSSGPEAPIGRGRLSLSGSIIRTPIVTAGS